MLTSEGEEGAMERVEEATQSLAARERGGGGGGEARLDETRGVFMISVAAELRHAPADPAHAGELGLDHLGGGRPRRRGAHCSDMPSACAGRPGDDQKKAPNVAGAERARARGELIERMRFGAACEMRKRAARWSSGGRRGSWPGAKVT